MSLYKKKNFPNIQDLINLFQIKWYSLLLATSGAMSLYDSAIQTSDHQIIY